MKLVHKIIFISSLINLLPLTILYLYRPAKIIQESSLMKAMWFPLIGIAAVSYSIILIMTILSPLLESVNKIKASLLPIAIGIVLAIVWVNYFFLCLRTE